jgi:hypothetical protein
VKRRFAPFALALAAIASPPARGQDLPLSPPEGSEAVPTAAEHRGPLEIRDEHVLAQGWLTLPALSPETLGRGVTQIRTSFLWSNSFSWTQDVPGEHPADRRFLIDGETRTFDVTVSRGFSANVDASFRLPLRWRGGGVLDGVIDAWHRWFAFLGVSNGGRPLFRKDSFRVEGRTTSGGSFSWDGATGFGLGNAELAARWRWRKAPANGWSMALAGRTSLPTASAPFEGSLGAGIQLLAARPLGRRVDLYLGVGGTLQGHDEVDGVGYEKGRVHGFAAFEWRPHPRVSLVAETDVASRLVRDIDLYPGVHWLLNVGAKLPIRHGALLELGLTENIKDQLSTTDLAFMLGLCLRP